MNKVYSSDNRECILLNKLAYSTSNRKELGMASEYEQHLRLRLMHIGGRRQPGIDPN